MATPNKTNGKTERAPRKEFTADEKRSNFKSAGAKRTSRAIKALRALSGVARPSRYSWTDADVAKILGALASELRSVEARFQNPSVKGADAFTL